MIGIIKKYKQSIYLIILILFIYGSYWLYQNVIKNEFYIDHNYEENIDIFTSFKKHIEGYDKKLVYDTLHPKLAFSKNNKIIGVYEYRGPEWGSMDTLYFLSDNEKLIKVIHHVDGNEYIQQGVEVPDLLVFVDIINKKTIAYGRTLNGEEVDSKKWLKQFNQKEMDKNIKFIKEHQISTKECDKPEKINSIECNMDDVF